MVEMPVELAFIGTRNHDQLRLVRARDACKDFYFNNPPYDLNIKLVWYEIMTCLYTLAASATLIKRPTPLMDIGPIWEERSRFGPR